MPPNLDHLFTPDVVKRLDVDTDKEIARDLGTSGPTVSRRRNRLGIAKKPKPRKSLIGLNLPDGVRWVVLRLAPRAKRKYDFSRWVCQCPCGLVKAVFQHALLTGKSRMCKRCGQLNRTKKPKGDR